MDAEGKGGTIPSGDRDAAPAPAGETGGGPGTDRRRAPWRAWAISILVAVVLSVAVTLLLGGSFGTDGTRTVAGGCGDPCCAPGGGAEK